jgi:hypothetical protein
MALAEQLAADVDRVLAQLGDEQRAMAVLPFDDGSDERRTWAYWPTARRGVPLHRLDRDGTKAVHRLLATLLPLPVLAQVVAVMGLDEVLDRLEGHGSDRRHRDDYWLTVFGEPGADVWGVRFEGHHVSVHATVTEGSVGLVPLFLGANPAVVRHGDHVVSAPLLAEEQLGFELLHALAVEERASAVVADEAPDDIRTRNDVAVDPDLVTGGVPLSALRGGAAAAARALLDLYLGRFPDGARPLDPSEARFAWAGAPEPGTGHYYRIAGPSLLVELDNTQDGANHVHTVVRHPEADFGGDVLARHHRERHPGA